MKIYYKNAGADKNLQCYFTSNYYLEKALKNNGLLTNNIDEADIIYIQENIGGLDLFKKYPNKIKVLQLVCSHPDFYCDIYYKELKKWNMMDVRPRNWKPIRLEEIKLADYIIVYSNFTKKTCVDSGVPAKKIIVIPKGVETDIFKPISEPKLNLTFKPTIRDGVIKNKESKPFVVGFAGQYQLIKGVQYIPFYDYSPDGWRIVMCGDKTEYLDENGVRSWQMEKLFKNVEDELTDLGKLTKEQMVDFYNSCDVLIMPSLEDSFGVVLLEALACNIPVITTVNCGAGELITHHKNGSIIPIRDTKAIVREIKYWKTHKAEGMRETALEHTMEKYISDIVDFLTGYIKYQHNEVK